MMLPIVGDRGDRQSLIATPPLPECEFSAIVPVKDEARNLPETLAALAAQTSLNGLPLECQRYEIIVLANNCTDECNGNRDAVLEGIQVPNFLKRFFYTRDNSCIESEKETAQCSS